jgi:hypothetical protein
LTEYDQSLDDLASLRGSVEGHAAGFCLASWIDAWSFPKDPDTHDDEPWEWDGLLGIPTDSKKDMDGIPRQIYSDATRFNEAILLEPKNDHFYPVNQTLPIQVYAADHVALVEYSLNGADWLPLEGSGHGRWSGFFKLPPLARHRQRLAIRALDDTRTILGTEDISFLAAVPPEQVTLRPLEIERKTGALEAGVQVLDGGHRPIAHRKIHYGFFFPVSRRESEGIGTSDVDGLARLRCSIAPSSDDPYVLVAAGTDSPDRVRSGDMRLFSINLVPTLHKSATRDTHRRR